MKPDQLYGSNQCLFRPEGVNMRRFTIAVTVVLCCLLLAGSAVAATRVNPKDIPSIDAGELLNLIGKDKGKVIVVNVFASWCPPCRDEIPGLVKLRRNFPEDKLVLMGVSVDKEPKALANYMQEMRINYPVKLAKGNFVQRVGVTAVPQLLIYNKEGELVINHRGLVDEEDLNKAVTEILAE